MGTGYVYWLMLVICITIAGWVVLTVKNITRRRGYYAVSCMAFAIYFTLIGYTYFSIYLVRHIHEGELTLALRIIAAMIAVYATFKFVVDSNRYDPPPIT